MTVVKKFSDHPGIQILVEKILGQLPPVMEEGAIEKILEELCPFLEEQAREISELTALGKALGTGKDIHLLLEMILSIARRFTKADGGTLYLVDHLAKTLVFNVIHNESLDIKNSGSPLDLPAIPLYHGDGSPNLSNVSSFVYHTGEIVNIQDVYNSDQFQFDGPKRFDMAFNYRSQSMVVIPMKNHEDGMIGILQLINARDLSSGRTISFSIDDQDKAAALASQASVILTQQMLILEMKELFEAFIRAIAVSIDEKSKHTGGHIQRVTKLCMLIARSVNEDESVFTDIRLSEDELDELRIAALMHDTGKITTPDHIIGKAARLETVCDRIELIKTRWELFKTQQKLKAAEEKLALLNTDDRQDDIARIDHVCEKNITLLEEEFQILSQINSSKGNLEPSVKERLDAIYRKTCSISGNALPYLTEDEFENLSIVSGTLSETERDIINSHARLTGKILNKLPWPKKLSNIPSIASAHHEKLDGSGYPFQLKAEDLNIQARILAIADIFEALSAPDRPYKDPMTLTQTIDVLNGMGEKGLLDKDIISVFLKSDIHLGYARKHLTPAQIDVI